MIKNKEQKSGRQSPPWWIRDSALKFFTTLPFCRQQAANCRHVGSGTIIWVCRKCTSRHTCINVNGKFHQMRFAFQVSEAIRERAGQRSIIVIRSSSSTIRRCSPLCAAFAFASWRRGNTNLYASWPMRQTKPGLTLVKIARYHVQGDSVPTRSGIHGKDHQLFVT